MTISFDLDAYLDRIGSTGEVQPNFETLARLLHAHMSRIPFENLDVLLGRPVRLDIDGLQNKLVRSHRGECGSSRGGQVVHSRGPGVKVAGMRW